MPSGERARVGLIADDLTGACDSAIAFLGAGPAVAGLWPALPAASEAAVLAVSTETRDQDCDQAESRTRAAAGSFRGRRLFRKLDSMLRGDPLADLAGVLEAGAQVLVAPALPAEGRVTVGGVQQWPGGEVDLRARLASLGSQIVVLDASTDRDLDLVARRVLESGAVAAGSAGLAAALGRALGLPAAPPARAPGCARPLAVCGSPAARPQALQAREEGWPVTLPGPGAVPNLGGADGLLLTGGETASRVLRRHGANGIDLLGEPLPRVPYGRLRGGTLDGLPTLLKAGSFGDLRTIARGLAWLTHGDPDARMSG